MYSKLAKPLENPEISVEVRLAARLSIFPACISVLRIALAVYVVLLTSLNATYMA